VHYNIVQTLPIIPTKKIIKDEPYVLYHILKIINSNKNNSMSYVIKITTKLYIIIIANYIPTTGEWQRRKSKTSILMYV